MDIVIWALAGAFLGWASQTFIGLNEGRGRIAPVIIGGVGGILGGKLIAPMFSAGAAVPGGFDTSALLYAAAAAAACLALGSLVHARLGV